VPATDSVAVRARDLVKTYGSTRALDGVDLEIPAGQVLGLLGPNGAGKTTTVRVLSTLLRPDSGEAWVAGRNVRTDPQGVRRSIGLSGQYAAVDENLTGFENLYMVGRFYGQKKASARERARELLARFRLEDVADRPSKGYSGGMRRRLDLAGALVAAPPVVILDEPTTGLDPRGRIDTWDVIKELVTDGTTVLLTTQYLEEADQLADAIMVIDKGRVIATGTAGELKARVGGDWLELVLEDAADLSITAAVLAEVGTGKPVVDERLCTVDVPVAAGPKALIEALRRLDVENVRVLDMALHRPTLDDVFLSLTGHEAGGAR
jgi:ABC-2 type transport system ATP-binding protein